MSNGDDEHEDDERADEGADSGGAVCAEENCHGEAERPEPEPLPVGLGEAHPLVFAGGEDDEHARWPRGTFFWRDALWVYRPEVSEGERWFQLEDAHIEEYYAAAGYTPRARDKTTWGAQRTLALRTARLEPHADGRRRRLVLDERCEVWEWDTYNLHEESWARLLERNLPVFPIEFLRATNCRTLLFDFHVGNLSVGVTANVRSGGTNWVLAHNDAIDPAALSGLCMTYAALNRAWFPNSDAHEGPSLTDLEAPFASGLNGPFTIYHEFGHIYGASAYRRGTDDHESQPAWLEERRYMRRTGALGRGHEDGLWDRFRVSSGYARGAGQTQRPGEGLAEAFRWRLEGTHTNDAEVERVLDEFMPTLESVQEVRAALGA
ncbi:MAG: hypothetical protein AB7N76_34530 [Planctomycetota bacterium]